MQDLGRKVVYQIYPRSFQDSDGDGMGDIPGITSRLDYLADLGVDLIWSTPFFVSPQHDNGYDVADYRAIDPRFGTMADFEELTREAAARGMGIMLDMVFNHTSTEHEWFQRALAGDEKYQDYYIFVEGTADQAPTNWVSKFGGPAWEWVPSLGKWYLHLFDRTQADLNWDNPAVRKELADVIRFWKDKGVSGFRFDVVNLISKPDRASLVDDHEGDGRRFYSDGPHVHEYLRELAVETGLDDLVTVGEMSSTTLENCIAYSNPDRHELSMTFSFLHLKVDYAGGDKWTLMEPDIARLRELYQQWQEGMAAGKGWNATFWDNHDQPRAVSRFCRDDDRTLWLAGTKMLATCIHFMRGTPYVYQGDELGMTNAHFSTIDQYRDVESLNYFQILQERGLSSEEALGVVAERSRDNGRTPMQWDGSEVAGFSAGQPWIGIPDNHVDINVEAEKGDPDSPLAFYKQLIAWRHKLDVVADGDIRFVDVDAQDAAGGAVNKVICYRRDLEGAAGGRVAGGGQPRHLLVVCSFADQPTTVTLHEDLAAETGCASVLCSGYRDAAPARTGASLALAPYDSVVLAW